MALKPWYQVSRPHDDLRQRRPLDAAQFAVHLDKVAAGDAPPDYGQAARFLGRTFITEGLRRFAGEVIRRLSGEVQGANAVHNLVTQFGGGKTHALTLLYHLATLGPDANGIAGVPELIKESNVYGVPKADVAVFVGTDWDAVKGRGGDGVPLRRTPWGDIAWQLSEQSGNAQPFDAIAEQDEARVRPGKEAIRAMLASGRPTLILMDEVMNFMTAARAISVGGSTLASQFYEFVHVLTEEADARVNLVVVVSLPASEQEMSAEDEQDFKRLAKATTRVAEPYVLSRDLEIPEIVRRRLFEDIGEASLIKETARNYTRWIQDHKEQLPKWFPLDRAQEIIEATYPFHPTVLSVFERKWQSLPSFQRTRGVLRLLAQWVADAYEDGYKGAHTDPLISLGTAPLDDQFFRTAVLDQLGEDRLVAPILADIAGSEAHAEHLDAEASETLRRARIHRKSATSIFFESSGGQARQEATVPEVRMAVGEPGMDIGNVETALDGLMDTCYYLVREAAGYRFSTKENLNRRLADRRAALDPADVEETARTAIRKVFASKAGTTFSIDPVFFPDESMKIENVPALRLVVLDPSQTLSDTTRAFIEQGTNYRGVTPREFRNALIWAVPESSSALLDRARQLRAWETIEDEAATQDFDDAQWTQIIENKKRAERDLAESVWRTYRVLAFIGADGAIREEDLGLVHSSAAESMQALIQARLRQRDELTDTLAPSRIVQNWPKGRSEWSGKEIRDAVFASPRFTRLLRADALKETFARGVSEGLFGYAAKRDSEYVSIKFNEDIDATTIEFSADVVLVTEPLALQLKEAQPTPETPVPVSGHEEPTSTTTAAPTAPSAVPLFTGKRVKAIRWQGDVPHQKWTTFYMKVLSKLAQQGGLTAKVEFEARPDKGLMIERVADVKEGLRDVGVSETLDVEEGDDH